MKDDSAMAVLPRPNTVRFFLSGFRSVNRQNINRTSKVMTAGFRLSFKDQGSEILSTNLKVKPNGAW